MPVVFCLFVAFVFHFFLAICTPDIMSARFDYILCDKIMIIGAEDLSTFGFPKERRLVVYNVITFCSLGDEYEAVA